LIDRPEVPDALLRINECLREGEIALEHTKAIARNDLSELTDYISKLESVMDDIQAMGDVQRTHVQRTNERERKS
jgi:hypothetical protein